jgi:hypothetical protein
MILSEEGRPRRATANTHSSDSFVDDKDTFRDSVLCVVKHVSVIVTSSPDMMLFDKAARWGV